MNKMTDFMAKYLMPISEKLSGNKYLIALRDGLMISMPLLIGSIAIVIGYFPIQAFHDFMTSLVGDVWGSWCWDMVNPATMGLVAQFAVVDSLATEEHVTPRRRPFPCPPISCLQQMDGAATQLPALSPAAFSPPCLHRLLATDAVLLKKNIKIKMPESVPSFVGFGHSAGVRCHALRHRDQLHCHRIHSDPHRHHCGHHVHHHPQFHPVVFRHPRNGGDRLLHGPSVANRAAYHRGPMKESITAVPWMPKNHRMELRMVMNMVPTRVVPMWVRGIWITVTMKLVTVP